MGFTEEVTLKEVIAASKGGEATATTKVATLTATVTTTSASTKDKDAKASRPLATKFNKKPSFSGDEDAHEHWMKMIVARLGQANANLLTSDAACAANHPEEN